MAVKVKTAHTVVFPAWEHIFGKWCSRNIGAAEMSQGVIQQKTMVSLVVVRVLPLHKKCR